MIVERIFVSPERGAPQSEREHITVEAGSGVLGDRNFKKDFYPGQNITLVEAEEIERFCAEHSRSPDLSLMRRNLVTRGVRLNNLVNAEFTIGNVRLRGIELCEPCTIVGDILSDASLGQKDVIKYWVRRGGLRADVLSSGEIIQGVRIELADSP
ncbi:MOSC domain-containing protein YiiM [Actimicrobium sp. GrIS 1.19]|uniref:MOSC domain-containing protein n=1 Tax=Actimicrobium sp. GrIS 1.19 TaxID=3071708 RepID=UPI002DFB79C9|nr:MOSC domain-containing protein YiiM [Actimicrobium sp. GrIS 1.19]